MSSSGYQLLFALIFFSLKLAFKAGVGRGAQVGRYCPLVVERGWWVACRCGVLTETRIDSREC